MSFPEAHVIFCDDVRREDNGKLLILGTYLAGMHAQFLHPPVSYPRLTIMVFARWRNRDEQEPVVIETRLSNQPEVFSRTEIDPLSLADEINSPIGRGVLMTAFLDGLPLTDGAALEVHLTVAGETRLIGWMPFTVQKLINGT